MRKWKGKEKDRKVKEKKKRKGQNRKERKRKEREKRKNRKRKEKKQKRNRKEKEKKMKRKETNNLQSTSLSLSRYILLHHLQPGPPTAVDKWKKKRKEKK
jgi:hypothetical protein